MQEMFIDSIRVSLMNYQRVVILKERRADRYLPIRIGSPEADAIALKLQDVTAARPLTHDLLRSVITALGATVRHVVVTDLEQDTFFAKLALRLSDGTEAEIDCRPSDAIAVAVREGQLVTGKDGEEHWFSSPQEVEAFLKQEGYTEDAAGDAARSKAPIFVEDQVLERAGVTLDADGNDEGDESSRQPRRRPRSAQKGVSAEEIEKMSAFSDFLQDLPGLEDLGKKES